MSETNPSPNDAEADAEQSTTSLTAPFVVAIIHKDAVEHLPVVVHPHELPILALVHGEQKVSIDENADLPTGITEGAFEPEDEFVRLEQRYGSHPDTKQSYASMVFGDAYGLAEALERFEAGEAAPRARAPRAKAATATKAKTARAKG